jgi:hypothetical protein
MIINLPKLGPVRFSDDMTEAQINARIEDLAKKYKFELTGPEFGIGETFMRGAKRGLTRMGSTFGDVIPAMAGSALGFDEYAKRQMAEAAETQRRIQETNPAQFESYTQVKDIPSAFKFAAETIGEATPDILGTVATGGIGGALVKTGARAATLGAEQLAARQAVGQATGLYLGSYAQNAPEVFQSVYQETGKLEPGVAALFGSVSAALDAVLPAQVLRGMTQPLKLTIAEKILERSGMNPSLLRKVLATVPTTAAKEGLTEGAQEAINISAEKFVDENAGVWGSKEFNRMIESSVRGAVAGGGFGTVGAVGERLRERSGEQASPSAEGPPAGTQGEMFTPAQMGPEFSPLQQPADQQAQIDQRSALVDQDRQIRGVLQQINAEMGAMANGQMAVDPARIDVLRKKAEDANAALTQIQEQIQALPELPGRVAPTAEGQLGLFQEDKPTRPISERMQGTLPDMEMGAASALDTTVKAPEEIQDLLDQREYLAGQISARQAGAEARPVALGNTVLTTDEELQDAYDALTTQATAATEAAGKQTPTVLDADTLNATGLPKQSGFYKQLLGKNLEDLQDLDDVMQIAERAKTNKSLSADTKAALDSIATQAFAIYGQQGELFGPRGGVLEPVKEPKVNLAQAKIAEVTAGKDLTDPVQVAQVQEVLTDYANAPTRSAEAIAEVSKFLDTLPSAYPEATNVIEPTEPVVAATEPSPAVAGQPGPLPPGGTPAPRPAGLDVAPATTGEPDAGAPVQSTALTTKPVENWFEGVEGAAVTQYKGKNKLVEMPIDTFLKLAERDTPGDRQDKVARVKKIIDENGKFSAVPYLYIETDSKGNAKVTGHEGRHRARALKALGYNTIPVELRSSIRWSEQQDPENFDYLENWPTNLVGQEGDVVPFPVSREQASTDYTPSTPAPAALEGTKPSTTVSAAETDILEGQARKEEGVDEATKRALYRTPEEPISEGMPKSAVQKIVDNIVDRWKNAPAIKVIQDIQELPPKLYQQMVRDNAFSAPGLYDPNTKTVYLIADNIPNDVEAKLTLAHEALGHFGLQSILGNTYGKVMDDIYNGNVKVRDAAKIKMAAGLPKHEAVEEVLAEMAEAGIYNNAIQRIFNAIRQFLRRLGVPMSKVTDTEIRELLANAQRFVVAAGPTREGISAFRGKDISYRVGTDAFTKWFGKSVVRNPDGSPKLMYHGTAQDIEEFRPKQAGAIFLTDDPRFAESFSDSSENYMATAKHAAEFLTPQEMAELKAKAEAIAKRNGTFAPDEMSQLIRERLPSRANIIPVYVSAQNPFDFQKRSHLNALADIVNDEDLMNDVMYGEWEAIESATIQEAIKYLGHDGFYVQEGGRKNLAVYDSSQIKSAFNQGTWSPTDKRISYRNQAQNQFSGVTGDINGLPPFANDIKEGALNAFSKIPDSILNAALGFMTMPQIAEVYGGQLPSINKLIVALENRATSLMARRQHVSENIQKWYKIANQHKASLPTFFDIANKTTLDQIDVLDPAQANNPLTKQFKQLPQGLQDVYAGMRKEYDDNAKEFMDLMSKNLSGSAASKMRMMFESNRLKVYLPLTRQGDYWLTFKDATGERVSMAFESPRERALAADKALKAGGTELKAHARLSQISFRTAPPTGFMGSVISELVQNKVDPAVIDNIYQTYMSLFPAESLRQQFRKREGVAGFNEDVFQAYANVASKMAQQLSNLEYADPVESSVAAIRQEATDTPTTNIRDVVGNIERQLEFLRNPVNGSLVSKASYFSYMMFIAGNVSSAVVNLTQLPIVVYPLLGGKYGFDKAAAAMQRATAMYYKGGKDNNSEFLPDHTFGTNAKGEYKQLYDVAVARAAIRRSTGYEITEARNTSVEDYTGKRAKIEHGLGWIFQNSERANREITLIAAFDLARQNGKDVNEAINEALKVVNDAHGASLAEIGPRFFQQGIGKVAFTFKRFAQSQIYLMGRLFNEAFRGADPETKRIARRQLLGISGMAYAFAGIQGMPLYGAVSLLAEMMLGDDDEPFDMDAEIRAAFGDIGYKGPINQILSVDIASRTGFNGLLWREDPKRLAEIGPTLYALEQAAGPAYGAFRSAERGLKLIGEGQIERGMEALVPSFVRNGMKAFRLGTEGALTKDGTPIVDDIGTYNTLMQVFGFNPSDLAEAQARAGAMKTAEKTILARRGALLDKLDAARMSGDMDGVNEIRDQIANYNDKVPVKLKITPDTMTSSYQTRRRNERESVDGITLDRRARMEIMEEYGQ